MTKENAIKVVIITIVLGLMANCAAFPIYWRLACGVWFLFFFVENLRFIFIDKGGVFKYGKRKI